MEAEENRKHLTLDHLLPRKHGGGNGDENLATACHLCNSQRQDAPLAQETWTMLRPRLKGVYT